MARPLHADGKVHGVVAACRRDDGKWLLVRRSAKVIAPLKVCFPGGGVEVGETQPHALVREMREELNMHIEPRRCVWEWEGNRPLYNLRLFGWLADMRTPPEPNDAEIAEVLWLTLDEASTHVDAIDTNADFCRAIRAALR